MRHTKKERVSSAAQLFVLFNVIDWMKKNWKKKKMFFGRRPYAYECDVFAICVIRNVLINLLYERNEEKKKRKKQQQHISIVFVFPVSCYLVFNVCAVMHGHSVCRLKTITKFMILKSFARRRVVVRSIKNRNMRWINHQSSWKCSHAITYSRTSCAL